MSNSNRGVLRKDLHSMHQDLSNWSTLLEQEETKLAQYQELFSPSSLHQSIRAFSTKYRPLSTSFQQWEIGNPIPVSSNNNAEITPENFSIHSQLQFLASKLKCASSLKLAQSEDEITAVAESNVVKDLPKCNSIISSPTSTVFSSESFNDPYSANLDSILESDAFAGELSFSTDSDNTPPNTPNLEIPTVNVDETFNNSALGNEINNLEVKENNATSANLQNFRAADDISVHTVSSSDEFKNVAVELSHADTYDPTEFVDFVTNAHSGSYQIDEDDEAIVKEMHVSDMAKTAVVCELNVREKEKNLADFQEVKPVTNDLATAALYRDASLNSAVVETSNPALTKTAVIKESTAEEKEIHNLESFDSQPTKLNRCNKDSSNYVKDGHSRVREDFDKSLCSDICENDHALPQVSSAAKYTEGKEFEDAASVDQSFKSSSDILPLKENISTVSLQSSNSTYQNDSDSDNTSDVSSCTSEKLQKHAVCSNLLLTEETASKKFGIHFEHDQISSRDERADGRKAGLESGNKHLENFSSSKLKIEGSSTSDIAPYQVVEFEKVSLPPSMNRNTSANTIFIEENFRKRDDEIRDDASSTATKSHGLHFEHDQTSSRDQGADGHKTSIESGNEHLDDFACCSILEIEPSSSADVAPYQVVEVEEVSLPPSTNRNASAKTILVEDAADVYSSRGPSRTILVEEIFCKGDDEISDDIYSTATKSDGLHFKHNQISSQGERADGHKADVESGNVHLDDFASAMLEVESSSTGYVAPYQVVEVEEVSLPPSVNRNASAKTILVEDAAAVYSQSPCKTILVEENFRRHNDENRDDAYSASLVYNEIEDHQLQEDPLICSHFEKSDSDSSKNNFKQFKVNAIPSELTVVKKVTLRPLIGTSIVENVFAEEISSSFASEKTSANLGTNNLNAFEDRTTEDKPQANTSLSTSDDPSDGDFEMITKSRFLKVASAEKDTSSSKNMFDEVTSFHNVSSACREDLCFSADDRKLAPSSASSSCSKKQVTDDTVVSVNLETFGSGADQEDLTYGTGNSKHASFHFLCSSISKKEQVSDHSTSDVAGESFEDVSGDGMLLNEDKIDTPQDKISSNQESRKASLSNEETIVAISVERNVEMKLKKFETNESNAEKIEKLETLSRRLSEDITSSRSKFLFESKKKIFEAVTESPIVSMKKLPSKRQSDRVRAARKKFLSFDDQQLETTNGSLHFSSNFEKPARPMFTAIPYSASTNTRKPVQAVIKGSTPHLNKVQEKRKVFQSKIDLNLSSTSLTKPKPPISPKSKSLSEKKHKNQIPPTLAETETKLVVQPSTELSRDFSLLNSTINANASVISKNLSNSRKTREQEETLISAPVVPPLPTLEADNLIEGTR